MFCAATVLHAELWPKTLNEFWLTPVISPQNGIVLSRGWGCSPFGHACRDQLTPVTMGCAVGPVLGLFFSQRAEIGRFSHVQLHFFGKPWSWNRS